MTITPSLIGVLASSAFASAGVTWNPADKGADVTLSGGDLIATGTGTTNCLVRATSGFTSGSAGKYYWEIDANSTSDAFGGICSSSVSYSNDLGYGSTGIFDSINNFFKFHNGAYSSTGVNITAGQRVGIAIDSGALKGWFSRLGTYILSGNPAAGTNQSFNLTNAINYFPVAHSKGVGIIVTGYFASASWATAAPSGFGELP